MISFKCEVENDKELQDAFTRLEKEFPKEMHQACLRTGSILVRRISGAVKANGNKNTGGKFQKLSDIRNALRPGEPPGGKLATHARNRKENSTKKELHGICCVWKEGKTYYCGYVSRMEPIFSAWQGGGVSSLSNPSVRHHLHRRLGAIGRKDIEIPISSIQPKRMVVDPVMKGAKDEVPNWILGNLNKFLGKTLTKLEKKNGRWRPS